VVVPLGLNYLCMGSRRGLWGVNEFKEYYRKKETPPSGSELGRRGWEQIFEGILKNGREWEKARSMTEM